MRASLLLPSDNRTVLRPESLALGFTQSEIGTWDDCAEKWYLGYNHMLRKRGTFAWYFVYGDAFHRTMQQWYHDGMELIATLQFDTDDIVLTADQEGEKEKWQRVLQVQMERYFLYYQDDLNAWTPWLNEQVVETEWEGVRLTGKLDLGFEDIEGENVLTDHKSVGRFDPAYTAGWQYRFQFMFYWWLAERVTGRKIRKFMVNALKKPALKQGKNESLDEYISRVRQDMIQRPEEYFKRIPLHAIAGSMKHFEERVLRPKLERIKLLTQADTPAIIIESLVRNQNTNNCVKYGYACQFMPICQNGFKLEGFQYERRENKHEELEAE